MLIQKLIKAGVISPPKWLNENTTHYLTRMGSEAYGCSTDSSDVDIYGFCIPPKEIVFRHQHAGVIEGFGNQGEKFGQWSEHHIKDPSGAKEYDLTIYSLVKFFDLAMGCSPNIIDALFTPINCVIYSTKIGQIVRENRKAFLHKKAWHTYKGYAFQMMSRYANDNDNSKINIFKRFLKDHDIGNGNIVENLETEEARRFKGLKVDLAYGPLAKFSDMELSDYRKMVEQLTPRNLKAIEAGQDTKALYHVVRCLNQAEQIMIEGDLDLLRNREQLKSIRRGEWSLERIQTYFDEKERSLEDVYAKSTLPHSPDESVIRNILLNCLEEHYGDLSQVVQRDVSVNAVLADMKKLIERYGG